MSNQTQDANQKRPKALGLYSGGLDSMLAALVLQRAGVDVQVVTFASPFFSADGPRESAHKLGLTHHTIELGPDYLAMVKDPPRGYGSNMNPCVDCHAFMLRKAGELADELGLDFLFTGEVMGQRPMSQNKGALNAVAKDSGRAGSILRPLSARLMQPTPMEESGLVDRSKLLDISGRGRKRQMELAAEFGLEDYPSPAGGCLLTDPGFSKRLKDLWGHDPQAAADKVEALKVGRHLRLSERAKLVVGRNQSENGKLEEIAADALTMRARDLPGPLALYYGPAQGEDIELAAAIVAGYGKAQPGDEVAVLLGDGRVMNVTALHRRHAQGMLL